MPPKSPRWKIRDEKSALIRAPVEKAGGGTPHCGEIGRAITNGAFFPSQRHRKKHEEKP
jgi:hypothetical protein